MLRVIFWAFTVAIFWGNFFDVKNISDFVGRNQIMNSYGIATHRINFGLALAWIIYACHLGHGGVVNRFLSSKYWMPLSRLSFCLYLVSTVIQYNLITSTPHQLNFETSHMVREALGITSSNSLESFRKHFPLQPQTIEHFSFFLAVLQLLEGTFNVASARCSLAPFSRAAIYKTFKSFS
jgi:hypothetical protein